MRWLRALNWQDLVLVAVIGTLQVLVSTATGTFVWVAAEPLPLLLRRTHPTVAIALLAVADVTLVAAGAPSTVVGAGLVVAAYSAGVHQPRLRSTASLGITLAALACVGLVPGAGLTVVDLVGAFVVTAVAWWVGTTLRERRHYAAALEAARLELAEHAVAEERLRLARELHDVVAHSLAVIAVHSSVGAHNAATRPQDAVTALEAVNTAAKSALGELRALLSVLRGTDRAPLPGLADLPALAAGVGARLTVTGEAGDVPRVVGVTAYRIVQEALTNAVKHAGPATVDARVTVRPGAVDITVTDTGRGGAGVPGTGLTGMRERVTAFGGTLTAGPAPDGGWRVRATLRFDHDGAGAAV